MKKEYSGHLVAFVLLITSCGTHRPAFETVGYAGNAKLGAVIYTDSDSVYYISGKERWNNDSIGMRLRVRGHLETKTTSDMYADSIKIAGISRQHIIHKARFEVADTARRP
jgi:hypothetical protein